MLMECLGEPIKIDGNSVLQNLRINITPNRQLRLKVVIIDKDENIPVDLVIFNYTLPKLEKCCIEITANGKEMLTNIYFQMKLKYNFIKRKWELSGISNQNEFHKEINNTLEIIQVLKNLITTLKK